MARRLALAASAVLLTVTAATWLAASPERASPVPFGPVRLEPRWPALTAEARDDALRHVTLWRDPEPFATVLSARAAESDSASPVVCRFLPGPVHGTTPKFDCALPDGEVVKVKYGSTLEIQGELAASRLLRVIGLGADSMEIVPRLRCYGCPPFPFHLMRGLDLVGAREFWDRHAIERWSTDFDWVTVEHRFEGLPIESTDDRKGWAWSELDQVDPRLGATRAEVDAFRLTAIFLAHWDNKMENQRLVCLSDEVPPDARPCPRPFALIHDLGSTFGPRKVNLDTWQRTPIWIDRRACTAGMRGLPYNGSTFRNVTISEGGRQMFLDRIGILSAGQVADIFAVARFETSHRFGSGRPVQAWVRAFQNKVEEVRNAGPCAGA